MATATHRDTASGAPPRAMRWVRLASWLPVVAAGGFYAAFVARSSFPVQGRAYFALFDDAMISMRYARNLAEGHGLVWNAGQHVEGYSNFLWTLWMSAIHLLGLPDRLTSAAVMISAALLLVLNLLVVRRLCELIVPGRPAVGVAAMIMTGLYYPFVFWALRGMEVGLAALLISTAALLVVELSLEWSLRRSIVLGVVLAAAVLTRDDLLVPCIVVLAYVALQFPREARARTLWIAGGALAVAIVGHEAFRLAYYGDALPNTYYLKLGGISLSDRLLRGTESVLYAVLFSLSAPLVLAAVGLVLGSRRTTARAPLALLAALFAAQCAYCVYVGGDAWEDLAMADRYVATAAPMLMVLAGVGAWEIASAVTSRPRTALRVAGVFAAVAVFLLLLRAVDKVPHGRLGLGSGPVTQIAPGLLALACAIAVALAVVLARRRRIPSPWRPTAGATATVIALLAVAAVSAQPLSDWLPHGAADTPLEQMWTGTGVALREFTSPGTRVALAAAGNVAYFDRRPGVDLLGKMDPVVARGPATPIVPIRYRPGHNKWNYAHSIGAARPPILATLWWPTNHDLCQVARWGYQQVAPRFYIRNGAQGIDVPPLRAALQQLSLPTSYPTPRAGCT